MGYSVFLSHSSKDLAWAEWIAANAKPIGADVYLYEYDPRPGKAITDKVLEALRRADALIVLVTPNSQSAPAVHQEIGAAKMAGKPVIPLIHVGVDQRDLGMLNGVDPIRFDPHSPETALPACMSYLRKLKTGKDVADLIILGLIALVFIGFGRSGSST